jgi:SulP family sulfate permease
MIAIYEAYRAGLLKHRYWLSNIVSGVIVGVVALPLAMAFAIASGVAPEQGIYTAIIAGLVVGLFGGSRVQIAGPTGAFVVILAGVTARYGINGLQVATLLAGGILILMGCIRVGNAIKYIPEPVIAGFTAGIAVIIFIGEGKDFFGLPVILSLNANFYQKLSALVMALPHLNIPTTLIAFLSLGLVLFTPYIFKRVPGPLVAMVFATVLQSVFHFKDVATIGSTFGGISSQLPHFEWPAFSLSLLPQLIGPAFTIALLGAIESLLSAAAADGIAGTRHNSNQELLGQGLANLLTPLFGGFAATGAIARTVTNIRNGGNSPLAAIVHSLVLILIIALLAPLASSIPLCTLAAILFVVAYNMSDIPHFLLILKRAPRYDVIVLLTTFFLTIFTDLVVAVNVGVIFAMLFFIKRMNETVRVEADTIERFLSELTENGVSNLPKDSLVYTLKGPFFFGVAEKMERALASSHSDPSVLFLRFKEVPFIDATGLFTLREMLEHFHHRQVRVYICEANAAVTKKLLNIDIVKWLEGNQIFDSLSEAAKYDLSLN